MGYSILFVSAAKGSERAVIDALRQVNYALHTLPTADQALQDLGQIKPDLVLLDAKAIKKIEQVAEEFQQHPEIGDARLGVLADKKKLKEISQSNGIAFACLRDGDAIEIIDNIENAIGLPPALKEEEGGATEGALAELQDQLYALKRDNRKLAEEKEEAVNNLKEQYQPKLQELNDLEGKLSVLKAERDSERKEIDKMEEAIKKLRQEKRELESQQKDHIRDKEEIAEQLQSFEETAKEKEETHHKAIEALREFYRPKVEKLEKLEEETKEAVSRAKTLQSMIRDKDKDVARMEIKLEKTQKQLEDVKELSNKLKGLLKAD